MTKKTKEYDIYTQSGDFKETELVAAGWPWASKEFWITVGITATVFIILNIIFGIVFFLLGFKSIFLLITAFGVAGGITSFIFKSILQAGDGSVLHRAKAGGSEIVTFYDQTLLPDKYGGSFSLLAYGPELAFKYPGTNLEGELDLSVKYTVAGIEGGKESKESFSVSCGKEGKAEDEILVDGICPLRRTVRYAYVTFIATRGFEDEKSYIQEATRGMMNNALDQASRFYSKYDLFSNQFQEFADMARDYFRNEFMKLQKTDPIFRGLAFMNKEGVKFSNARDSVEVQAGRNAKAIRLLASEATNDAALAKMKLAKDKGETLSFEDASKSALIDSGIIKKSDEKKTFNLDPETAKILAILLRGGKS